MGNHHNLNVVEFLHTLANRGETVTADGQQLHYRTQKGADQSQTVNTLRQHKDAVLAWLHERASTQNCYPLGQGQLGLWLDWQRDPDNAMYNLVTVIRLHQGVQLEILHQAIQRLVDRHPALRTVYQFVDEQPQQQVQTQQTVDFIVVDGSTWTEAEIQAWIESEAGHPFDLAAGPLMRLRVLQIAPEPLAARQTSDGQATPVQGALQPILHWTIHHIAADLFTTEILLEELRAGYRALLAGEEPELASASLTYRDFVRWEQDTLAARQTQLATFWQTQLGDTPLLLNLPAQSIATQHRQPKPVCHALDFTFDPHLVQQLRMVARSHEATLYTLLLAAYQVLLNRYTGQKTFLINSPTAVRNLPGLTNLVGYLVNPILVRADLQSEPDSALTFVTLLQRTQQTVTAAMAHQLYPYHAMLRQWHTQISAEQVSRGLVGFIFDTMRRSVTDADLFAEVLVDGQHGIAEPLSLFIFDHQTAGQEQLTGRIVYHATRFERALIERMIGHFQTLLESVVAHPDQAALHLPMLTQAEHHQLVHAWNDTAVDFGPPQTIQAIFEQQVARTPEALAVVMDTDSRGQAATLPPAPGNLLTYAELNARANQLAHHLIKLGVQADTLVAVALERSTELVVSLLAVLKAGGAYLPIDPSYPPARIRFMLADSAAPLLLTQAHLAHVQEAAQHTSQVILVDDIATSWAGQSTHNPQTQTTPTDLVYVIYTSGSTGQPKGVMIQHNQFYNLLCWHQRTFAVTAQDRASQLANPAFDATGWELFPYLTKGATLVFTPDDLRFAPAALANWLAAQAITIAFIPTPIANALLEMANPLSVRWLLTGGDKLSHYPPADATYLLVNNYGPTENTVVATSGIIDASQKMRGSFAPHIGRAVANVQLYILNDALQPIPLQIAGELYIGGVQLARGYLNRPDLTAERFIEHPEFGRLYKTGDLCRWLPDGHIEYLGRTDFQVKIRGFRIELGEIESALRAQTGVREAVVLAREDTPGDKRLVAYVVGDADQETLRQQLARQLPEYMTPAVFIMLEAMPLTPNGKLDRHALPAPNYAAALREFVAPRTATEAQVAAIWQEVLGIAAVGLYDNFFALGGHSLLATQVISRIRQTFTIDLPLRTLFEAPTVASLAQPIEEMKLVEALQPPLEMAEEREEFAL